MGCMRRQTPGRVGCAKQHTRPWHEGRGPHREGSHDHDRRTQPGRRRASDRPGQPADRRKRVDPHQRRLVRLPPLRQRADDAPSLVCLQHFRGNLDSWDPALVDRLAKGREVILLDNRGVGGSTGVVPDNVTDMARDAPAFIDALGLKQVDILVFSLGGYVAQELTRLRPHLVRRLVLAGTAPQGGPDLHRWSDAPSPWPQPISRQPTTCSACSSRRRRRAAPGVRNTSSGPTSGTRTATLPPTSKRATR